MPFRKLIAPALASALLLTAACTANINTPPVAGGGSGQVESTSALEAFSGSRADAEVQALGELRPYRVEETGSDAWVIYYYAPERDKSYRCVYREGEDVVVTEVTAAAERYRANDEIEQSEWKIDSEQARTAAVQAAVGDQSLNMNLAVTNLMLVSAERFAALTGMTTDAPVWICQVEPPASPAPSPSVSPTTTPSAEPTSEPTAEPTATPGNTTIINPSTTVYINAKNGNQIAVNTGGPINTGTQTETETEVEVEN